MGVTGLWRLIEPAGKPVPVETLENKVLAVDISIWLHQMVKGYQDAKGAPLPNAHLMGLFQRLCKLLYFRVKPVFVFDGGFPDLKKETIGKRQDHKAKYNSQSEKLKREIALLLGKKTAIGALLGTQISPKKNKQVEDKDDIFKLPALPEQEVESDSESDDDQNSSSSTVDLHSLDFESDKFKNLPLKDKYDLLLELKETRKMNSWGKIHTLPKKSDNFSDFQMQRLLKRRKLQECLEETEKEMGDGGMSLAELESLLNEEGIDTRLDNLPGKRIASNDTTRYLLISNVKQALAEAKKKEIEASKESQSQPGMSTDQDKTMPKQDELEDDIQKAIKMSLECVDETETSACASKTDDSWTSLVTDSDYSDDEDEDGFEQPDISSAKAYIMQYSDFTHEAIDHIVCSKNKNKSTPNEPKIDKIINELNQEKTIIEDDLELLSSDEEVIPEKINKMDKINSNKQLKSLICETHDSDKIAKIENKDLVKKVENKNYSNMNDDTLSSVVCYDNSNDEIIVLETSSEDQNIQIEESTSNRDLNSESSEDDFIEVADSEEKHNKNSIQLTLNMGKEVEDDIFADIFDKNDTSSPKKEKTSSETTLNNLEEKEESIKPIDKLQNKIKVTNNDIPINIQTNEERKICNEKLQTNKNSSNELSFTKVNSKESIEINTNNKVRSLEQLNSMVNEIENEEQALIQEKGRLDRIGRNITEQMTKEAQELLRVFGIPYIIAPMEAEAQCAFLETVKLTDGTITDDSDIWLFGGKTVYKNFFNQKKHVLQFLSERIEKSFNLSREQLVLLSLLVGSDYTTGVTGIGPVTALEILAMFPFNQKKLSSELSKQILYQELVTGLQDFKKWVNGGKRTDNVSLKRKLKNVTLSDDFPSLRVVQAYLEPNVERNDEKFTWGELDITILREYTKAKFGWSQNKLDEIIKPVVKRLQDRKSQKTVYDYFKRKLEFNSLEDQMSKRVKAAVQKMASEDTVTEEDKAEKVKTRRKKKTKTSGSNTIPPPKSKNAIDETKNIKQVVRSSTSNDTEKRFAINVSKSERYQEIIPQREKDKKHLFESKLKAIELFRKTKIDPKMKPTKRKLPVPKEKAELSESDSE